MKELKNDPIKLTRYCEGAGCGCKISPKQLMNILATDTVFSGNPSLIVGNEQSDDAAVYDLKNGTAIISTTDFFTPIVDDPFTFGRIAATNAISDVYAMGGKPLLAIAILGWPVKKLPDEVAREVVEGGRSVCEKAGITLAGGHSIENLEPIFGLAVTGLVDLDKLKRNNTAETGNLIILTKPIGVGILATAQKRGVLTDHDAQVAVSIMTTLNSAGAELGKIKGVTSMTDVTGFGLLGHLIEMCEGSGLSAEVEYDKVPVLDEIHPYLAQKTIPGGTNRNWDSYGHKVELQNKNLRFILADPQTSGGLLLAVRPENLEEVQQILKDHHLEYGVLGRFTEEKQQKVYVIE